MMKKYKELRDYYNEQAEFVKKNVSKSVKAQAIFIVMLFFILINIPFFALFINLYMQYIFVRWFFLILTIFAGILLWFDLTFFPFLFYCFLYRIDNKNVCENFDNKKMYYSLAFDLVIFLIIIVAIVFVNIFVYNI